LVPQPAVHKRILIIFGHFCPHEPFTCANCCHVVGLQFVLDTNRLRSISACPSHSVSSSFLSGKRKMGFTLSRDPEGSTSILTPRVGHVDTSKNPQPGHRPGPGPRSRSTCGPQMRPPHNGVFGWVQQMRPPHSGVFGGVQKTPVRYGSDRSGPGGLTCAKLSSEAQMGHWIFVLVQKDSNAKKESFCCTEP
jgi:hypothetical protein